MTKCTQLAVAAILLLGPSTGRLAAQRGNTDARILWLRTEDGAWTHGELLEAPGGQRKETALVAMHPRGNHGFFLQGPLAKAGYSSLALVARHNTDLTFAMWEDLPLDLAAGVKYMLAHGYKKVVLMGNSASGPLLTSYQDLAENADERQKWYKSKSYTFPKAEGLILSNPTPGHAVTFVRRLDPAVVDEETGRRDPSLDMFNPKNWSAGDPKTFVGVRYSPEFLAKYRKAQSARLNRLMDTAEKKLKLIEAGKGRFNDDDIIVVKGVYAHPCHLDLSLCGTEDPAVKADPAIGPSGLGDRPVRNMVKENSSIREAAIHSYRSFLSFRAIRSTDPYTGLDYSTSNAVTPYHIARVSVPILFLISTGDEQVSLQDLDENTKPIRKGVEVSRFFVKGADHGYSKPEWKEKAASGAQAWLEKRFN
jgi:hypothetical protein